MSEKQYKSVAVVTSTIGRPELERCIQSIKNQTYPCQHYIFVDGKQFEKQAKKYLKKYSDIIVTYLPMNTGANGWTNSSVNAIAPFLVKEDIIFHLDDDNWYEADHIERCMDTFEKTGADYVYALRKLYTPEGEFICEDFVESIGFYQNKINYPLEFNINFNGKAFNLYHQTNRTLIDTNCYAFKRELAILISSSWYSGWANDFTVFKKLIELNAKYACSNAFTVNYTMDLLKTNSSIDWFITELNMSEQDIRKLLIDIARQENQTNLALYGGRYPWQ